jgi:hypothetical protein
MVALGHGQVEAVFRLESSHSLLIITFARGGETLGVPIMSLSPSTLLKA